MFLCGAVLEWLSLACERIGSLWHVRDVALRALVEEVAEGCLEWVVLHGGSET